MDEVRKKKQLQREHKDKVMKESEMHLKMIEEENERQKRMEQIKKNRFIEFDNKLEQKNSWY